jgi:hypothetical protein
MRIFTAAGPRPWPVPFGIDAVIVDGGEGFVNPEPIPDRPAVNPLRPRHPTISNEFVEFGDADADVFSSLLARQAARRDAWW